MPHNSPREPRGTNFAIARAILGAGMVGPMRPRSLVRIKRATNKFGASLATRARIAAILDPERTAVVDDAGSMTFLELDQRARGIAAGLHASFGVDQEQSIAILCRNHRGALEATIAGSRLGANVVLLNTDFSGPQLRQSLDREQPALVIVDDDLLATFEASGSPVPAVVAWNASPIEHSRLTLDDLANETAQPPAPTRPGQVTILTSGTTGVPRGAPRPVGSSATLGLAATALKLTGLKCHDPIAIGSPIFHGFGFGMWVLSLSLRSPVVLQRRFDALRTVELMERHQVVGAGFVPLMVHRVIELLTREPERKLPALRAIISAGAPVTPDLAQRTEARLGPVLFNAYGSSEVGIATFATPADMREQTGSVGCPTLGSVVAIFDDHGDLVPAGTAGRIFVKGRMVFDGYSAAGGSKERIGDFMATGDRGMLDGSGRLAILGREDDMILSGGENVYPQEVEDLLIAFKGVSDVAVVGVPDPEFGERLAAYIVRVPQIAMTESDVQSHVKARLARFKTPRDVFFIDEIPRNASGKVLRTQLRKAHAAA